MNKALLVKKIVMGVIIVLVLPAITWGQFETDDEVVVIIEEYDEAVASTETRLGQSWQKFSLENESRYPIGDVRARINLGGLSVNAISAPAGVLVQSVNNGLELAIGSLAPGQSVHVQMLFANLFENTLLPIEVVGNMVFPSGAITSVSQTIFASISPFGGFGEVIDGPLPTVPRPPREPSAPSTYTGPVSISGDSDLERNPTFLDTLDYTWNRAKKALGF